MPTPPPLDGVLETVLYAADLARATAFYRDVLGLAWIAGDGVRFQAFDAGRRQVLLIFRHGATSEAVPAPRGGVIPPHTAAGEQHLGLAIAADDYAAWKAHLLAAGVAIESEAGWTRGGRSLYFRDPDGHLLELITPGIWPNY